MKIGALARLARCTTQTIRFYEQAGLMPPTARSEANYRVYRQEHLERLRFIRNCRSLDMSHEEIRSLLQSMDEPQESCAPVNSLLDEHIVHVDVRLRELERLREQLVALRERCDHASAVPDCGIIQGLVAMQTPADTASESHLG